MDKMTREAIRLIFKLSTNWKEIKRAQDVLRAEKAKERKD